MGRVFSVFLGPFRDFNLESRVNKVISKTKPTAAPKHKSNKLQYEQMLKEYPQAFEETLKKDEKLYDTLKGVYVTSQDPVLQPPSASSSVLRPLPANRKSVPDFQFGFREPESVPRGKVTLRTALKFITEHQAKPAEYTISDIAAQHKIPEETLENILKYFRVYEVYVPEKKTKATFAGPLIQRRTIVPHKPKELSDGNEKG